MLHLCDDIIFGEASLAEWVCQVVRGLRLPDATTEYLLKADPSPTVKLETSTIERCGDREQGAAVLACRENSTTIGGIAFSGSPSGGLLLPVSHIKSKASQ